MSNVDDSKNDNVLWYRIRKMEEELKEIKKKVTNGFDGIIESLTSMKTYIEVDEQRNLLKKEMCKKEFQQIFASSETLPYIIKEEIERTKSAELKKKEKYIGMASKIFYILSFIAGILLSDKIEIIFRMIFRY